MQSTFGYAQYQTLHSDSCYEHTYIPVFSNLMQLIILEKHKSFIGCDYSHNHLTVFAKRWHPEVTTLAPCSFRLCPFVTVCYNGS